MERPSRAAHAGPPRSYQLDGDVYELTGSWWPLLERLAYEHWQVNLLLDITHDAGELFGRLMDPHDDLGLPDLRHVTETLVQAATGRPWWVAQRLLVTADAHWELLDGTCLTAGVDLAALIDTAPARACNVIYAWLVEGADDKARDRLDHKLTLPPPELIRAPSPQAQEWMAEREGASFMAAMGAARSEGLVKQPQRQGSWLAPFSGDERSSAESSGGDTQ